MERMEKQLTAVEWLVEKMTQQDFIAIPKPEWIEQAKAMEKEQIIKTAQDNFYAGQDLANGYKLDWNSAEDYYKLTFKSE